MIERDERSFEHDLRQWASDCIWALDNEKVRILLLDIFSRRTRVSNIQARLWKRVVDLYWREGRTTPEIAEQFGVGKEEIRRIVKNLRRHAKEFFDVNVQPIFRQKTLHPPNPKP